METRLLDQIAQRLAADASRRGAVRLLTTGTVAALGGAALHEAAAKGNGGNGQQGGGQANGKQSSGKSKRHHGSGNGNGHGNGKGKGHRNHNGNQAKGAKSANAKTCLPLGADCGETDRCCGQGRYCAATAATLSDKKTVCCQANGMACANDADCCGAGGSCKDGFCAAK
ncbi:MAG TPA: hypothetical protein VFQ80_19915 [Thermomicrobiales bacterium]|jgi:hypothetical protein|nr:hypothetical protein [Thermomicrobiales bacterium]